MLSTVFISNAISDCNGNVSRKPLLKLVTNAYPNSNLKKINKKKTILIKLLKRLITGVYCFP
jgi:hypothetical protein